MKSESDSASKPMKYPTMVRFDEDELPEITKWKVGGKYKITLDVEQMSMSKGDEFNEIEGNRKEKPKTRASFKVLSVTPLGGSNTKDAKRPGMMADAMKKKLS